jgi:hypothetical protein
MTTTYSELLKTNLKHMSASAAYELLNREAEKDRTSLKQYVALMKQHVVAKDKEMAALKRQFDTGAIPIAQRAKTYETWQQGMNECNHLTQLSSLYGQHSNWLRDTAPIKPAPTKVKKTKAKEEVKAPIVVVEPASEEDEWELNATNFSV